MTKPFKLTVPRMPETNLHAQAANMLDRLLAPPAMWATYPAGHIELSGQQADKLFRLGLKRSWPDIFIIYHAIFGIELKAEGGKLSKTHIVRSKKTGRARIVEGQEDVFPRLRAAGMPIETCGSLDQILMVLRVWQIPLRISVGSELVETAT